MKLNLYGGNEPERALRVLSGGYDTKQARVVLIVQDDNGAAGTLTLDPGEAMQLASVCANVPKPERVEVMRNNPNGGSAAINAKE